MTPEGFLFSSSRDDGLLNKECRVLRLTDLPNGEKHRFMCDMRTHRAWFFFTLLYLVIDYGRPHDILPIGFLRLGMVSILILTIFFISQGNLQLFQNRQVKMICYLISLLALFVPIAKNNYFAYLTTRDMILFVPFILSILICVNSIERLKIIISVMIGLMLYVSLYSLFHRGLGSGNYFADENDLSLYVNTYLPFCYFLFIYERTKLKKIMYVACTIIGIAAIVKSNSRGGFVGMACMVSAIWWLNSKKVLSIIVILIIGFLLFNLSESYKKEMSTIEDTEVGTAHQRIMSWKSGWDMFLDNPLGVGGNNFQVRFPEYQSSEFQRGMWGRVAHSLWFTLLPELGILGIIIYFRLIYYNLKDVSYLKNNTSGNNSELEYLHSLSLAFIVSLIGFFASATFLSVLYYPHYYYLTALIVVTTVIGKDIIKNTNVKCEYTEILKT